MRALTLDEPWTGISCGASSGGAGQHSIEAEPAQNLSQKRRRRRRTQRSQLQRGGASSEAQPAEATLQSMGSEANLDEFREWLCSFDNGKGHFLKYLEAFAREFDYVDQVILAKKHLVFTDLFSDPISSVTPGIWQALGVSEADKLVIAQAICALQ